MEEKELFEDYEIDRWQPSPKIYQILGASVLLHLFAFFTIAQFNLLQTKACDSPYVGKVCQALDFAYLGTTFLGQDPDFVNKDYEKTEISEADVTYVDVSRTEPPLQYPEGYFAMTNPEGMLNQSPMMPDMSGYPPVAGSMDSPMTLDPNAPQILPTPNNDVANQKLPDSPFSFGNDSPAPPPPAKPVRVPTYKPPRNRFPVARQPKLKNESPGALPGLDGEKTAKNSNANSNQTVAEKDAKKKSEDSNKPAADDDELDPDRDKFNQKPLKDFGTKYGEQILSKEININAPFKIEIIAKLDKDGKLTNAKMVTASGSDPQMSEVAKEAIRAFSDSKLLRPLYDAGGRDVKITFAQNNESLQAIIQTQAESENVAKRMQSGINFAMSLAKTLRKGSDEANLMEKADLATQGKTFIINFMISNDEKTQMIERSLKNLKQELEKKAQPNSVAVNKDTNSKG